MIKKTIQREKKNVMGKGQVVGRQKKSQSSGRGHQAAKREKQWSYPAIMPTKHNNNQPGKIFGKVQ